MCECEPVYKKDMLIKGQPIDFELSMYYLQ